MKTETLVQKILEYGTERPEDLALAFRKERLTYADLAEQIRRAAAGMAALGVRRGDRVLYTAASKPQTFVLYLAAQYLGAVAVPTDKAGTAEHELALLKDAEGSLLLTNLKMKELPEGVRVVTQKAFFAELPEAGEAPAYELPDGEEIAEILFTSGTTGKPKGVMLSYRAVLAILTNTMRGIGITGEDVVLMPLPLHHSLALRVSRATLFAGGSLILQNGFAFAKETENNLDTYHCTGFVAVPVSMELLRGQMQEHFYEIMGRFSFIEIGAGALTVEQRKRLSANLPNVQITNTWGSSETGGVIFAYVHEVAGNDELVSTLGRQIDTAELAMLPAAERTVESAGGLAKDTADQHVNAEVDVPEATPPGTDREHPGRLALRGEMVMSGYWKRPDLTADALRDGWLVTNDLVYFDADGYVYMLGRSDDIINIGGEKLSPIEVENIASEYEGAEEYACIGVPDPEGLLGQVPVLFVGKSRDAYSAEDLRVYLASRMERIKLPARIIELPELPRNRMQKLDRRAIRALYEERSGDS